MSLISKLIIVADVFCIARKLSRARVSTLVFNDGKALGRLAAGGDLQTANYSRALTWFSSNWPAGVEWPAGVVRPPTDCSLVRPWPALSSSEEAA